MTSPPNTSLPDGARPLDPLQVRLVTLNIRYATKRPGPGEEPWAVRCPRLCAQLRFITSGQDSPFISISATGVRTAKKLGEHSPIFFRADRWECERSRTLWLSPTPDTPSRGWDAALERIVTMGSFRHRATGTVVVVMSTHLDHRGEVAREQSARLLISLARTWPEQPSHRVAPSPVFLGGDFNSTPTGRAYNILVEPGSGITDISDLAAEEGKYGNREVTYTTFGDGSEEPKRIDFLFVRNPERFRFLTFSILPNVFDDKVFLSDHRPVVADVEVPVQAAM
ncbi:hypothetical protein N0V88_002229 [Collariella sp. IMI 366227]|nr:hypothetical protein N0V88_002229 [Collariella sp. IMI 366227]